MSIRKAILYLLASTAACGNISRAAAQNSSLLSRDLSVKPGDDFYRYANGGWLKTAVIPAGRPSYDSRTMLVERTSQRVRDLVQGAAAAHDVAGSLTQKVRDYYASFMDEDSIEARGMTPLDEEMAGITAIADKVALSAFLGASLNSEVEGLTSNADHILGVWINQGFEDSDHNFPHLLQGGLGLPTRDDYIDSSPQAAALRGRYQTHIAAILKLLGIADPEGRAARVMSLEVRIAESHAPESDAADVFKQNNQWKRADFSVKAPGMDWEAYFRSAGLIGQSDFVVWQPSAVTGTAALVGSESIDVWKDYLRFHLVEHYSSVLPKAVAGEDFSFYGATLAGSRERPSRSNQAIVATNGALGQAVGQLYTQRYFPPETKRRAQAMVEGLIAAYKARLSALAWMSPQTKIKALAKLDSLEIGVGYPDNWVVYSTLNVERGDALGNLRRAEAFNRSRNLLS